MPALSTIDRVAPGGIIEQFPHPINLILYRENCCKCRTTALNTFGAGRVVYVSRTLQPSRFCSSGRLANKNERRSFRLSKTIKRLGQCIILGPPEKRLHLCSRIALVQYSRTSIETTRPSAGQACLKRRFCLNRSFAMECYEVKWEQAHLSQSKLLSQSKFSQSKVYSAVITAHFENLINDDARTHETRPSNFTLVPRVVTLLHFFTRVLSHFFFGGGRRALAANAAFVPPPSLAHSGLHTSDAALLSAGAICSDTFSANAFSNSKIRLTRVCRRGRRPGSAASRRATAGCASSPTGSACDDQDVNNPYIIYKYCTPSTKITRL